MARLQISPFGRNDIVVDSWGFGFSPIRLPLQEVGSVLQKRVIVLDNQAEPGRKILRRPIYFHEKIFQALPTPVFDLGRIRGWFSVKQTDVDMIIFMFYQMIVKLKAIITPENFIEPAVKTHFFR